MRARQPARAHHDQIAARPQQGRKRADALLPGGRYVRALALEREQGRGGDARQPKQHPNHNRANAKTRDDHPAENVGEDKRHRAYAAREPVRDRARRRGAQDRSLDQRRERLRERERDKAKRQQRGEIPRQKEKRRVSQKRASRDKPQRPAPIIRAVRPKGDRGAGENAGKLRERQHEPDLGARQRALDLEPARQKHHDHARRAEQAGHDKRDARGGG